jgi:peroxiredoxin
MARLLHPLAGALAFASLLVASGELSNRPAPDFRLADSKGRFVALSDFKGKPLLVEFLSTTCPHCQKFAPILDAVRAKFKGRVGVVAIATYPDNASTINQFVQNYKVSYPILVDPGNTAAIGYLKPAPPNYGFSIPHLFVVDQSGYIRDDFTQTVSNPELFTVEGLSNLIGGYLGRR